MGKPSPSLGWCRGLSQAQDKPLSLAQSPVPCMPVSPDTDQDRTWHLLILHSADVYGIFTKRFKKVPVSEACLHILNLLSFQTFH